MAVGNKVLVMLYLSARTPGCLKDVPSFHSVVFGLGNSSVVSEDLLLFIIVV